MFGQCPRPCGWKNFASDMPCIPCAERFMSDSIGMPFDRGMRSFAADAAMTSEGTMCDMDPELDKGIWPM